MIKGTEDLFSKLVKELDIEILQNLGAKRYFIVLGKMKGKKVIFKLRRLRRFYSVANLKTEILTSKVLAAKELSGNRFQSRGVVAYSMDYPQWVVFEYVEGESADGEKGKYWMFSREFYSITSPEKMFELLKFWQEDIARFFSANKRSFPYRFRKYRFPRIYEDFVNASNFYLTDHLKKSPEIKQVYSKDDKSKGEKALRKFKSLIDASNKCVSHGDMNPWNILIHKEKTIVIDYETTHLDIPYVDFAFVWSASWNNLAWRNDLRKLFLDNVEDKEAFKLFFSLNLVRFLPKVFGILKKVPGGGKDLNNALEILQKDYQNAIDFLEKAKARKA